MPAEPIIPPTQPKSPAEAQPTSAGGNATINVPLSTTSIDDKVRLEVDFAAYRAVTGVCSEIYKKVNAALCTAKQAQLVILDSCSATAFQTEASFRAQARNLEESFSTVASQVEGALDQMSAAEDKSQLVTRSDTIPANKIALAPAAIPAIASALSLLKVFETDTVYSGRAVTIPFRAFALELANQWSDTPKVTVFISDLDPHPIGGAEMNMVQAELNKVMAARGKAYKAISNISAAMRGIQAHNPKYSPGLFALNFAKDQFQAADSVLRDLSTKLNTPDATTNITMMQLLERAARLRVLLKKENTCTFFLFVEVLTAGGSYRIVKNLLRSLFWADGLETSGGVIAMFGLFNADGGLLRSGVSSEGAGFLRMKQLWSD